VTDAVKGNWRDFGSNACRRDWALLIMPHFMGRIMGAETLVTSGKFSLLIKSES
jgi:hypothetical protein